MKRIHVVAIVGLIFIVCGVVFGPRFPEIMLALGVLVVIVLLLILGGVIFGSRIPEIMLALGIEHGVVPIDSLEKEDSGFTPQSIGLDGITGEIWIRVHNPNPISAKIDTISFEIFNEDDQLLATGGVEKSHKIPPNSYELIKTDINVGWGGTGEIVEDKLSEWVGRTEPIWEMRGEVHIDIGPATCDVPFRTSFPI